MCWSGLIARTSTRVRFSELGEYGLKSTQALISDNFRFLAEHDPVLVQAAAAAERVSASDPKTTLIKLRQFGEALARNIAARIGLPVDHQASHKYLMYTPSRELQLDPIVRELFHGFRIQCNRATHEFHMRSSDAMPFHQAYSTAVASFRVRSFVAPVDPSSKLDHIQTKKETFKHQLLQASIELENSQQLQLLVAQEKAEYEGMADTIDEYSNTKAKLAQAYEQQRQGFDKKLQALQQQSVEQVDDNRSQQRQQVEQQTRSAARHIVLSEEPTRVLIDQQQVDIGLPIDSEAQNYALNTRPETRKNKAISKLLAEENGNRRQAENVQFLELCCYLANYSMLNKVCRLAHVTRQSSRGCHISIIV